MENSTFIFSEAKKFIERSSYSKIDGKTVKSVILPSLQSDYLKFLAIIKQRPVNEDELKSLSSDNRFIVRQLNVESYPNI